MSFQGNQRRDDRDRRNDPPPPRPEISAAELDLIIGGADVAAVQSLIEKAKLVGEWLKANDFSTSQIRNIFGEVRLIEQAEESGDGDNLSLSNHRKLLLLKPKLAYQHARAGGEGKKQAKVAMGFFQDLLSRAIDQVGRDRTRFQHFVEFFEAILAYHRSAGGKS